MARWALALISWVGLNAAFLLWTAWLQAMEALRKRRRAR